MQLNRAFSGDIVSVSLKPISFGRNIVLDGLERSYPTMVKQILTGLEDLKSDIVFFTECDVLYHPSHFEFIPEDENTFYYNTNNWRWDYPKDRLITYKGLTSLSMLCCYRKLAVDHYRKRLKTIVSHNLEESPVKEPLWARKWGYEPGRKRTKRGGFSNEKSETWDSLFPNIDIRHDKTFSRRKVEVADFTHPPDENSWMETNLDNIPGWIGLKKRFMINSKKK